MDGFNKRQAEFNASPEERRAAASNASGKEFQGVEESSAPAKKKRSRAANGVRTFLFGLTAAAVVTAAAVLPANAAEAQIVDLGATDTVISYTVDVKEMSGPLKLVLYNDFSRREAELFAGENSGKFADLQPDMRYTVAIESGTAFGGIALEKREVSTLSPEEVPVTELVSVSHECTCDVDGLFHFEMEFTDENGWWSAFEATLTDADGNVTVEIGASLSNINEAIKQMTIGDAVEIVSTSSRVLQYMKDFKLDELDAGIKAMTIADAIAINEDSHAVINAIADLTLDDLSRGDILQSKLDTLRLGQVITVTETSPKILKALQYSRLGTLGEAVDRLEMQDVFENIDSGVLSLIPPTTLIDDIPDELTAAIKKTSLYGLQQIDLFKYNISGEDYFTETKTIERSSTHNALIGDVVQVIAERTFDGLTVEFVKLYRDTNDKLLYAGLPDGSGTPVRIEATTGAEGMVILDAEDVNKILGVLPEADRYSAVITVDVSVGSDLTVLGGSYDTLFSIDMQDADGNLWIGDASAKVEFPNKVGGYAFFHANGSVHLNGAVDGITASGAASPEDIPVATIAGGTKPMTLIELISEDWSGTGA